MDATAARTGLNSTVSGSVRAGLDHRGSTRVLLWVLPAWNPDPCRCRCGPSETDLLRIARTWLQSCNFTGVVRPGVLVAGDVAFRDRPRPVSLGDPLQRSGGEEV